MLEGIFNNFYCSLRWNAQTFLDLPVEEKDLKMAYVGEDWYLAVTQDDKIISYISKNCRDLQTSTNEMNEQLKILQSELKYEG